MFFLYLFFFVLIFSVLIFWWERGDNNWKSIRWPLRWESFVACRRMRANNNSTIRYLVFSRGDRNWYCCCDVVRYENWYNSIRGQRKVLIILSCIHPPFCSHISTLIRVEPLFVLDFTGSGTSWLHESASFCISSGFIRRINLNYKGRNYFR